MKKTLTVLLRKFNILLLNKSNIFDGCTGKVQKAEDNMPKLRILEVMPKKGR
jgi:hypothetical protein